MFLQNSLIQTKLTTLMTMPRHFKLNFRALHRSHILVIQRAVHLHIQKLTYVKYVILVMVTTIENKCCLVTTVCFEYNANVR